MTPTIKQIREDLAAATPGPWWYISIRSSDAPPHGYRYIKSAGGPMIRYQDDTEETVNGMDREMVARGPKITMRRSGYGGTAWDRGCAAIDADMKLIAHAPEYIAHLLAEVDEARALLSSAELVLTRRPTDSSGPSSAGVAAQIIAYLNDREQSE